MKPKLVTVILPIYNQADHIAFVLRQYVDAFAAAKIDVEFLAVVNGVQHDKTLEICEAIAADYPVIRVIRIEQAGWGRPIKAGLAEAKGDILCYVNCARTQAVDLVTCVTYGLAHPDVTIKGNRKIRASAVRSMGSLLYNLECRYLYNLTVWDMNGTPKVFPRHFHELLKLKSDDSLYDLEFHIVCQQMGYKTLEVPITSTVRFGGTSTTTLKTALSLYGGALRFKGS
jgi:glycosyltransferase involved in cell wall biosynthesis